MPRRTDIHSILIIGSGPIVIGQGCEFDYSGVQACRALREEGYRIVLINSNPATIMTDPQFADATYIEPITPEAVEKILAREKANGTPIDALLPTLGGQTGLNTGMACFDSGLLTRYGVKMIGADRDAIHKGEDRQVFKDLMLSIGLNVPRSGVVHTMDDARKVLADIGLPLIIRPAFTLGGTGGGIAYNREEFEDIVQRGLDASPVTEVLIEQSVIGYKEFEMEVVRDKNDNCIVVCSIENIDAMGVHTGDSITVAPIQTLTDKEYQKMRDASFAVIRAVGVETGGSNIQFGINPKTGEMVVIEMNPRVSRSSALASKATGYPIAKIAAKLAVGYTLDELPNPITTDKAKGLHTSACFEPSIDYCVIKIPRWTFEKFPDADETLTTQMKSVGEAMAIGRTFKEAWQKAVRSMEVKRFGFGLDKQDAWLAAQQNPSAVTKDSGWPIPENKLRCKLSVPGQGRMYYVRYALKMGWTIETIHELTHIDPWFLAQFKELTDEEWAFADVGLRPNLGTLRKADTDASSGPLLLTDSFEPALRRVKQLGYSDVQLATLASVNPGTIRYARQLCDIDPVYKLVDTCAAEFEAATPYYYSTYETPFVVGATPASPARTTCPEPTRATQASPLQQTSPAPSPKPQALSTEDEIRLTEKPKVIIIGGGPNRIGQGIEFDYCCVQAAFAMKQMGIESVMINSNPETVSTDYDTSDLLFFEPLTHEDVLNICERLNGGPFKSSLEIDQDAGSLTETEHAALKREIEGRKLGACLLTAVWRNSKDPKGPSGFLIECAGTWPRVIVLKVDGSLDEYIDDASGPAKDHRRSDNALYERVGHWHEAAPKSLVKGVIVQFGGQTPLNLARGLHDAGVPIIGTSIEMLEAAGDREKFRSLVEQVGLKQPENGIARSVEDARKIAAEIGYPVLVRPSFVLGGRAMEIVSDEDQLNHYMAIAVKQEGDNPILVDKFLDHATECDVDCIADYDETGRGRSVICGVMEHIEEAGIHSGDSACSLPPYSLFKEMVAKLKENTHKLAKALKVRGLMNVQYAIKDGEIYLIEVNPRASRTIPFVGKATGHPWALYAAKVMAGMTLDELGVIETPPPKHVSVKEVVFPFAKFPGVDIILGPEMRSTGEVMGIDDTFDKAFAKAQIAAGSPLPTQGTVYISVNANDKADVVPIAKQFEASGFKLIATGGTHQVLTDAGIAAERINKLSEGRPNLGDAIKNGQVQLIVNTPTKKGPGTDEGKLRGMAVRQGVTILTTLTAAKAAAGAIADLQKNGWAVKPLQAYFPA